MPKVPDFLLQKLMEMPDAYIDEACRKLGIADTLQYHIYMDSPLALNRSSKNFLIKVFSTADTVALQAIYNKIELGLLLGGCVPYVGIIVNIIDACFCFALGNILGCAVAIISCFPIPGFKVVCKGIDNVLIDILNKISLDEIVKISRETMKRVQKNYGAGWFNNVDFKEALKIIRDEMDEIRKVIPNPFSTESDNILKFIETFPSRGIQKDIATSYEISYKQINLLSLTERGVR